MRKRIFALAAVLFSSLALPQATFSQDSTVLALDEAMVTATKYPTKTSLTGKVVIIIGKEEIDLSPARDLSQLLSLHSGFTMTGANGSPGKDKTPFLRGAAAEYTLIMIDGIPVFDPSGIGGHFDIRNISLANIERIEIVKGSQSTLYGSHAIAGVINIITKKTTNKKTSYDAIVSAGSNETFKLHGGVRGNLDRGSYYLNYSGLQSEGINDVVEVPGYGPFDRDGFRQHAIDAGGLIRVRNRSKVHPFLRFTYTAGDIDDGSFADELDFIYDQHSFQAGLNSETSFGKSRLHLNYSFSSIRRSYTDDSTLSRNGFDIYSDALYEGTEHFVDAYVHVPFANQWKLTGGADLRHTGSDQRYESLGSFPYSTKYSGDSLHQTQVGIYAALNLSTPGGFNMEAGGRVNLHSEYGIEPVFNLNPSWLINNQWKLFTNLSSGFRTPTVYQLYSEFGNADLQPEKSLSFEAGMQYFSPGNKLMARALFFKRTVDDILFFFTDPTTFRSQYINQDRQRDHGIEVEGSYMKNENFRFRIFYNYLDGNIHTKVNGRDTSYRNLIRRPMHSLGFATTGKVGKRITFTSNLNYVGQRKDLYFDPFLYTTVHDQLDDYFLWDLYAEYRFCKNRVAVFGDLRNITDSKYTEISGFRTLGRNGYLGIRMNF